MRVRVEGRRRLRSLPVRVKRSLTSSIARESSWPAKKNAPGNALSQRVASLHALLLSERCKPCGHLKRRATDLTVK